MSCPQCGANQQSGARFCPMCGTALEATVAVPPGGALAPGPMPRQRAGAPASTSVRPDLSASQSQELQRQIAAGLLNPYRQRIMGYAGADDSQLLMVLLERAAKDDRFRTALAYVANTRDVMAFETILDHPEQALPLRIEMWAERHAQGHQAGSVSSTPARARRSGHTTDDVLCPSGHRVLWYAPACPTCGSAVGATAPPAPLITARARIMLYSGSAVGATAPPAPPGAPVNSAIGPLGQPLYYAAPRTNGYAIASMVLGILWLSCVGSVLALIFGYMSLGQIRKRGEGGRGMAIAGIVLGWVGVALAVILIIVLISAANSGTPSYG